MNTDVDIKNNHQAGDADSFGRQWPIPPRQQPYAIALELSFDTLAANPPSREKLESLGAKMEPEGIRLSALNRELLINLDKREVIVIGSGKARVAWALLALHYLNAEDVTLDTREATLARFSDSRGYLAVFGKRIVGRFLKTVGRTGEMFAQKSERIGGALVPSTGLCYSFNILPRAPVTIVRHEGDEDFGPGANVIYRADIERLLPAEDRVVAVELLLDTLSGAPIDDERKGALA